MSTTVRLLLLLTVITSPERHLISVHDLLFLKYTAAMNYCEEAAWNVEEWSLCRSTIRGVIVVVRIVSQTNVCF